MTFTKENKTGRWLAATLALAAGTMAAAPALADPSTADYVNIPTTHENSFQWQPTSQTGPIWTKFNPDPTLPDFPDGPGVSVHIIKSAGGDRNLTVRNNVFQGFSSPVVGTLYYTVGPDAIGRTRIQQGSQESGRIIFDSGDSDLPARIFFSGTPFVLPDSPLGTSEARLEFRAESGGTRLDSDLVVNVDAADTDQGGQVRFRGRLVGPGDFIVDGPGEVRYRSLNSEITGNTIVREGMLRIRNSDIRNSPEIIVEDGGQLRLDARGNVDSRVSAYHASQGWTWKSTNNGSGGGAPMERHYRFGPTVNDELTTLVTLNGFGRDPGDARLGGPKGALRMQGQGTREDIGWLHNNIYIDDIAGIHTSHQAADTSDASTYYWIEERGSILHLTGNITGGDLVKSGRGFIHLHNNNTYGDTIVQNGDIIVEETGSLGTWAREFTFTYPGDEISTDKMRTVRMLNAAQSVSRLNGAVEGSGSIQLDLSNGHTFTANQSTNSEFQGQLLGQGAFVKAGGGQLILSGQSTHTGGTTINGGELLVRGSLDAGSQVMVNQGGKLSGNGSVGHLSGDGTVRPDSGFNPARLTASSLDGSDGMNFEFFINGTSPNLTSPFNSTNSVLDLAGGFTEALTSGSMIDLIFGSSMTITEGTAVTGGFLTSGDHFADISGATIRGYQNGDLLNFDFAADTILTGDGYLTRFTAMAASLPMLLGDFDNSGLVGSGDLALVLTYWGTAVGDGQSPDGFDVWVNTMGVTSPLIGSDELALVLSNWGNVAEILSSMDQITAVTGFSEAEVMSLIPEPTSLALLGLGALGLLGRRRGA